MLYLLLCDERYVLLKFRGEKYVDNVSSHPQTVKSNLLIYSAIIELCIILQYLILFQIRNFLRKKVNFQSTKYRTGIVIDKIF